MPTINQPFRVEVGTVIDATENWYFTRSGGANDVRFDNAGRMNFVFTGDQTFPDHIVQSAIAFSVDRVQGFSGPRFNNEATGVISVTSGPGVRVSLWGFYQDSGITPDILNDGLFEVIATGTANVLRVRSDISVTNNGVLRATGETSATGVVLLGLRSHFNNTGLIEAIGGGAATALYLDDARQGSFQNTGRIIAVSDHVDGAWSKGLSLGTTGPLVNEGLIQGDYAVYSHADDTSHRYHGDWIENRGTLRGAVYLATGNDTLINKGLIDGAVDLGLDNDVFDGSAGIQTGPVYGFAGDDRLTGGDAADILLGEDGADILRGGGGDDYIEGGRDGDDLDGGKGWDTVSYSASNARLVIDLSTGVADSAGIDRAANFEHVVGTRFADLMIGSAADDVLEGGRGGDRLFGGGGDDIIFGGRGDDDLTGGEGADVFLYATGDSADLIRDFHPLDRIRVAGHDGWRALVQHGQYLIVEFSDTDRLWLQNVALETFDPLSVEFVPGIPVTPEQDATVGTQIVSGDYQTYAEEHIDIRGVEVGVVLTGYDPAFTNNGHIDVRADLEGGTTSSIWGLVGSQLRGEGKIVNAVGASIVLEAAGMVTGAEGFFSLENHGLFSLKGGPQARGYITDGTFDFKNTGQFLVTGILDVIGIELFNGDSLFNSGLIRVEATSPAEAEFGAAMAARVRGFSWDVINDGEIIAISRLHSSGISYTNHGSRLPNGVNTIVNNGRIEANLAIWEENYGGSSGVRSYVEVIRNTGQLIGNVKTTYGREEIYNSGLITGAVSLGDEGDLFDGALGIQVGWVFGEAGDDDLRGGAGGDRLDGGAGADVLDGGAGDDVLLGGGGADVLRGGDGVDLAIYSGLSTAYGVTTNTDGSVSVSGTDGVDTLTHVERLLFTDTAIRIGGPAAIEGVGGDDLLAGTIADDFMSGLGGHDVIFGGDGRDILLGGDGDDILVGNAGIFVEQHDALFGGAGNDVIHGERADTIVSGEGHDSLIAINGYDWSLNMTATSIEYAVMDWGNDVITAVGQTVGVSIFASGGNDVVDGSSHADLIFGGVGDDVIRGGQGDDAIVGEAGSDQLHGGDGNDRIYFTSEDRVVNGGNGYDVGYIMPSDTPVGLTVNLGAMQIEFIQDFAGGDDIISSHLGSGAIVFAGAGSDTVRGGMLVDIFWGEDGNDILSGDGGADTLVGGGGMDSLSGGPGMDAIYCGADDGVRDRVFLDYAEPDFVHEFEVAHDLLDFSTYWRNATMADLSILIVDGSTWVRMRQNLVGVIVGVTGLTEANFVFATPKTADAPMIQPDLDMGEFSTSFALSEPEEQPEMPHVRPTDGDPVGLSGRPAWAQAHFSDGWLAVLV